MKQLDFDIKRNVLVMQLRNLDKQFIEENSSFAVDDKFKYMGETYEVLRVFVSRQQQENGKFTNVICVHAARTRLGRRLNDYRTFTESDFKNMKKL